MYNIGERLKYLRKEVLNLTQEDFAKRLLMSNSNVSRYENNEYEFTERIIKDICREFDINEKWLKKGIGSIKNEKPIENIDMLCYEFNLDYKAKLILTNFLHLDETDRSNLVDLIEKLSREKTITLPFYDILVNGDELENEIEHTKDKIITLPYYDFPVSAGLGNPFNDYTEAIKKDFVANSITQSASFTLCVRGDSMDPTIKNGQEIFIKSMPQIEFGEIGIFSYNNEAFCKRLIKEGDKIILRSDNPKYADIVLSENDNVITFGKVLM